MKSDKELINKILIVLVIVLLVAVGYLALANKPISKFPTPTPPTDDGKNPSPSPKTIDKKETTVKGVVVVSSLPEADTIPEDVATFHELFQKNNIVEDSRLVLKNVEKDEYGTIIFFYVQVKGISMDYPVNYHFNKTGEFTFPDGGPDLPPKDMNVTPKLSASEAMIIAKKSRYAYKASYKQAQLFIREETETVDSGDPHPNNNPHYIEKISWSLVWKITPLNKEIPLIYIDAMSGEVVYDDDGIRY